MTKRTLLCISGAMMALGSYAVTLTPEQALQRASSSADGKKLVSGAVKPALAYTEKTPGGEAAVYVFNKGNNGGFMLISADDDITPLLGYSDEGSFDLADIPLQLQHWLGEYGRQIEYAKSLPASGKRQARQEAPASWAPVAPMLTTKWDQGTPYNNQTPTVNNKHTPTGCVATAMAQIMKYHNYPEYGQGTLSTTWDGRNISMNLGRTPLDWNNMLDTYVAGQYNDQQAEAVSYLMKACGYGAKMKYALSASGTQTAQAGISMVQNFLYDSDIQYNLRLYYTDTEWTEMMYNEMKNRRPVLYDGSSSIGGHAFVVDGYDGNGYFHLNWGWGGMCNGYYLLTALNPTQQGAGGSKGGYNYNQGALYNIKKAEGQAHALEGSIAMFGNLSATASNLTLSFTLTDWNDPQPGFFNISLADFKPTFGIAVQKADGTGNITYVSGTQFSSTMKIGEGVSANFHPIATFPSSLANGRYKVTLIYKNGAKNDAPWKNFQPLSGMYDYVYVTKNGNSLTVENLAMDKLSISNAEIVSPLYYGNPCKIEFTITNSSNRELIQTIIPTLSVDGTVYYESDSQLVAVGPNQTVKKTLIYTLEAVKTGQTPSTASPKDFILGAKDFNTGTVYGSYGKVTMYRSTSNVKVALDEFSITNASAQDGNFNEVDNFSDIKLKVKVSVGGNNAFLASPLTAVVYETMDGGGNGAEIYEKEFENYIYLASGDSATETTVLDLSGYDPWRMYNVAVYYLDSGNRKSLGTLRIGLTGVENVTAAQEGIALNFSGNILTASSEAGIEAVEVYDTKGSRMISSAAGSLDLSGLCAGIYIVTATDRNGASKTIKIAR